MFRKSQKISENLRKPQKTSENLRKSQKISENLRKSQKISIPIHNLQLMKVFQGEGDFGCVEASPVLGELSHFPEMIKQLSSWAIIQHKIQLFLLDIILFTQQSYRLEGVLHSHDKGMVNLSEDVAFGLGVFDLILHLDHRLVEHLHGVDLILAHLSHLEHFAKAALSNHLQDFKVVDGRSGVV